MAMSPLLDFDMLTGQAHRGLGADECKSINALRWLLERSKKRWNGRRQCQKNLTRCGRAKEDGNVEEEGVEHLDIVAEFIRKVDVLRCCP